MFFLRRTGTVLLIGVALSACDSSDPIKATPAVHATTAACAKADKSWPIQVGTLKPYAVTTPSNSVRAWGTSSSNAIIARCGVSMPGPTTDPCVNVSGIDWVQHELEGGYMFTTYGRNPSIEVLVPNSVGTAPLFLPAFAKAAAAIPQGSHRCSSTAN